MIFRANIRYIKQALTNFKFILEVRTSKKL